MLGQLSETKIKSILSSQAIGRLACTGRKYPYVVPITYSYDGKAIYAQSNEGKKMRRLRKHVRVCLEVDLVSGFRNWQSVLVYGKFEELKRDKMLKARRAMSDRVFPLLTSSTIHPFEHAVTAKPHDSNGEKMVMYRIKIKKWSGRFEKQ